MEATQRTTNVALRWFLILSYWLGLGLLAMYVIFRSQAFWQHQALLLAGSGLLATHGVVSFTVFARSRRQRGLPASPRVSGRHAFFVLAGTLMFIAVVSLIVAYTR